MKIQLSHIVAIVLVIIVAGSGLVATGQEEEPQHTCSLVLDTKVYEPGQTALFVLRSTSDANATFQIVFQDEVVIESKYERLNTGKGATYIWDIQKYAANGTYTAILFLRDNPKINDTETLTVFRDFGITQHIYYAPIPFNITILDPYGRIYNDPVSINVTNLYTHQSEEYDDFEDGTLEIKDDYQEGILALPGQAVRILVSSNDDKYYADVIVSVKTSSNNLYITLERYYKLFEQVLGWLMGGFALFFAVYIIRKSINQSRPYRPIRSDPEDIFNEFQ